MKLTLPTLRDHDSHAHIALDRILEGEHYPDRGAVGIRYYDGSSIKRETEHFWTIDICLKTCTCLGGERAREWDLFIRTV